MAESDVLPRFFKVYLSETASEKLAIPRSFNEHLEDPLPQTAKLHGTGGKTWTVSFKKIRNYVYFTVGWSKFAEDHHLRDGEFLTFVYDGYHTFEVSVYGRSACKETRAMTETVELSDEEEEEEEEEEEDEDTSMDAADDPSFGEAEEVSQSIYAVDSSETESDAAVVAGISNMEVTTNICFDTTLKNRIYELLIPATVVREYGLTFGRRIKYIDEEGIIEGEKGKWSDDRVCFKGWGRICRRNRLKEDDTVKCEILRTGKRVHSIRIHVQRG